MSLVEAVRLAAESLWSQKMRAFLTMLGVIIGVGAVIAVMAIGQGGKAVILKEVETLGANAFMVMVKHGQEEPGREVRLTMDDIKAVKQQVPAVRYLYPMEMMGGEAQYRKEKKTVNFVATTADFQQAQKLELKTGRFFNDGEVKSSRRVVVIDSKLAEQLFPGVSPVGKKLRYNGFTWTVIGVVKERKSAFSFGEQPGFGYVPITSVLGNSSQIRFYYMQGSAADKDALPMVASQVKALLNKRHKTVDGFEVQTLDTIVESVNKVVNILTLVIGSIAGISLLVGGIGVMNIMLVSVTERTREIGIRKSLGATRQDILLQFLVEALVLCLSGGLLGILLGAGGAFVASRFLNFPPLVNGWTVLVAVSFSLAVGLFFGIYPANKAARLDPIEALRYE